MTTSTKPPDLLSHRLIGFFDILGFSDRLRTMDIAALHKLYARLIDDVANTVFNPQVLGLAIPLRKSNFDRANFLFDSIVLVSRDLTVDLGRPAIHDFLMSCSSLMEKSFVMQLPLRGAIGFGDYLEDNNRNIFLSREFADLVRVEKAQEWSGCIVLPSALKLVLPVLYLNPDAESHYQHRAQVLAPYDVPFKGSANQPLQEYWSINWVYFLNQSELEHGLTFLTAPKLDNTTKFVRYIEALPYVDRLLPETFRPAVRVLGQGTLGGVRIKFVDASGNGVDPPNEAMLSIKLVAGSQAVVFHGPPIPEADRR
jgi:hypothetical protein